MDHSRDDFNNIICFLKFLANLGRYQRQNEKEREKREQ